MAEELRQRFDVWQADARPLALPGLKEALPAEPWLIAVASRTEDQVLAYDLVREAPGADVLWELLQKAMTQPETSEPHRPSEIQLARSEWCMSLQERLDALGIVCTAVAALPEMDTVFAELGGQVAVQSEPGLLDVPGATPAAVGSFFDAAAVYYEQAPWKRTGDRPIKVECARFASGPWYGVVTGQAGLAPGLVLYDSLEALLRVQQGDRSEEENARKTAALLVSFGPQGDLPPADRAALQKHGWRVASENAYPTVYRLEPGLSMRPPLVWELTLLEGCLRAVPEFLRKKTRRREPFSLTVPAAEGELALVLSWENAVPG